MPHSGPQGKGESDPQSIFQQHGNGIEGSGEDDSRGAAERPQQDGAAAGKDSGPASASERPVRGGAAGHGQRRPFVVADKRRSQKVARISRGSLSAPHQSPGGNGGTVMVKVYAVDGGRGGIPGTEERAFHPAFISSTGAARQGPRHGGVPRLRSVGHVETSAEAPAYAGREAIGERSRQSPATFADESARPAFHPAKRRHRSAHH